MHSRFVKVSVIVSALGFMAGVAASSAQAQGPRGGLSNRGGLSQGYQGGQSGSQLPFSAGGQGAMTQGGFGQGGLGQGGIGMGQGRNMGRGGMGGGTVGIGGQAPIGAGLNQSANERFQQDGFVGRDANDVQTTFDGQNGRRGPGQMMDQMIENLNEMREARRRWREQNSAPPPIRVRLVRAFDVPVVPPTQAATIVQTRLTKAMVAHGVGAPQVEIAGRTAFLRGVVPSERDRALIERLALLEPGVSRVENLVSVQGAPLPAPQ